MTGYVRQSAADIIPNNDILAAHFNNEFNRLQDAFDALTGHTHTGALGDAPLINVETSVTGILPEASGGTGSATFFSDDNNFLGQNTFGQIILSTNDVNLETDILLNGDSNIAATGSLHQYIDSNAAGTTSEFTWNSNSGTQTGATNLMSLNEDGELTVSSLVATTDVFTDTLLLTGMSTGIGVHTGAGVWAARTLVAGTGISITTPDGVAGNIAISTTESGFPSGTRMLFQQTSAPTGWTKDATQDNKALRVISGTVGSGGTLSFTSAFSGARSISGNIGNTALTEAQLPAHTHGTGNLSTSNSGNHTHNSGNYFTSTSGNHTHGDGNLTTVSHSHGSGNLNTSNTGAHRHFAVESGTGNDALSSNTSTVQIGNISGQEYTLRTGNNEAGIGRTSAGGAHSHNIGGNTSNSGNLAVNGNTGGGGAHSHNLGGSSAGGGAHTHNLAGSTGSAGSGSGHNHSFSGTALDMAVQYIDVIIASKD